MDPNAPLELTVLPGRLAICRLAANAEVPSWATAGPLTSITRTGRELSIVCGESGVPGTQQAERGYVAFEVAGPLPLEMTGVSAALALPLAKAGVCLFAVSTYDTDYVLVKEASLDAAIGALRSAGHTVVDRPPSA